MTNIQLLSEIHQNLLPLLGNRNSLLKLNKYMLTLKEEQEAVSDKKKVKARLKADLKEALAEMDKAQKSNTPLMTMEELLSELER